MNSVSTLTLVHVGLSILALASGFVWLGGVLASRPTLGAGLFVVAAGLTSFTGFLFPITAFTPALGVGAVALPLAAVSCVALCRGRLRRGWKTTFVVSSTVGLYLNTFVLVAQLFQKVPPLAALAPTQREAPFLGVQLVMLLAFVAVTIEAVKRMNALPAGRDAAGRESADPATPVRSTQPGSRVAQIEPAVTRTR